MIDHPPTLSLDFAIHLVTGFKYLKMCVYNIQPDHLLIVNCHYIGMFKCINLAFAIICIWILLLFSVKLDIIIRYIHCSLKIVFYFEK